MIENIKKIYNDLKIINKDLEKKIDLIYSKYYLLKKILQDNSLSLIEKQKIIENNCIYNLHPNKNQAVFQLKNIFYKNIYSTLEEHSLIKKKDHLRKLIEYVEHIDIILLNSLNNSFIRNEYNPLLSNTTVAMNLKEELKQHCIYKMHLYKIKKKEISNDALEIIDYFDTKTNDIIKLITIILQLFEKEDLLKINYKIEKFKTKKMILLSDKFISNTYNCRINITNLPMIIPPNDWTIKNNNFTHYGGYLWNYHHKDIQLIHFNRERSEQTSLNEKYIDIINHIQKQPYQIDVSELNKFFPFESIINKINEESLDISLQFFSLNQILQSTDISEIIKLNKSFHLWNKIEKKNFKKEYHKTIYNIAILIETLYLAELYKDFNLYFPIYNDFRNRLYYHSYPLNIQSSKLTKSIIKLNNIPNKDLISLDATASGLQILSTILKDEKILNLTNLLNNNDKDIYEYYRDKFELDEINQLTDKIKTKKNQNVKIKLNKFSFFKKRKLFKKLLMTYTYNKEIFGMSKDIEHQEDYNELNTAERYYHMRNLFIFFKKEFHKIERFKSFINKIIDNCNNSAIILNQNSNFIATQFYAKQVKKKIDFMIEKKKYSMTLYIDKIPRTLNKRKSKQATMPNFIHNLDSHILFMMLQKCIDKNIPIFTIHDCFVISKEHEFILRQFYLNIFNDILKTNVLEEFLDNNIEDEEIRNKIYNEYIDLFQPSDIVLNNLNGLKKESLEYVFKF